MTKTYKTEGIVLKRINFGEADKIITVFSKHYGKLKCLAKGIRKVSSRKGGNLELFNLVTLFLVKGRNLDIVTEAQVQDSYAVLRENLKETAVCFQLVELVDKMTRENQANWQLYQLLTESFKGLCQPEVDLDDLVLNFKIRLLEVTGFGVPSKKDEESIDSHIETIIEKKLFSLKIFEVGGVR